MWPLYNLVLFLLPYNIETKENMKSATFLARYYYIIYHVKPYGSWFWHVHCMLRHFFCCIQRTWQIHSPIFHRHSHQAWLQIGSQCLTIFSHAGGTSYILLLSSLQVSMIFVFLCLSIIQLSLTWHSIWSALWISLPQILIRVRRNWPIPSWPCSMHRLFST